jgi:hypothetical protein
MSDSTLIQSNSSEEMVEFENPFNGDIYLIRSKDIRKWELKREQLRLRLVARHLSAPSHLARVAEDPENWVKFANFILGRANYWRC